MKVFVADRAQKSQIDQLGFDVTEHAGQNYVEVVAYGAKDLARLTGLGFRYETVTEDLVKEDIARATTDRLFAQKASTRSGRASLRAAGDVVPSGRTEYRHLADYEADMKKLVAENPGLVKPIILKEKTIEGRAVNGIEITTNVAKINDGKPVFAQMGVHHAREWPSGEHAMEWAFELDQRRQGRRCEDHEARRARCARSSSRSSTSTASTSRARRPSTSSTTRSTLARRPGRGLNETAAYLVDPALNYKRRNCRLVPTDSVPARRLRDAALPRLRRRPEPQLRRPLGRPGRERPAGLRHLPRHRPVLRARDAQHPRAGLEPPGHDADHEPHVLEPRAPPAGGQGARARPSTSRR